MLWNRLVARRYVAAVLAFALLSTGTVPSWAQTFAGKEALVESPGSLRALVTQRPQSNMIRVRYENSARSIVHIRVYTASGRLLYSEDLFTPSYVADWDLTTLPPGTYSLEIRTPYARHKRSVQIVAPVQSHIRLLPTDPQA